MVRIIINLIKYLFSKKETKKKSYPTYDDLDYDKLAKDLKESLEKSPELSSHKITYDIAFEAPKEPIQKESIKLTWEQKRKCLFVVQSHKNFRFISKTIPQPYFEILSKLANIVAMYEFLVGQPDFENDETSEFYQHSRDLKIVLGDFDRILNRKIIENLENGNLELEENKIREYLDVLYLTELNSSAFQNWVNSASIAINKAIAVLSSFVTSSENYGPFIQSFLIKITNTP